MDSSRDFSATHCAGSASISNTEYCTRWPKSRQAFATRRSRLRAAGLRCPYVIGHEHQHRCFTSKTKADRRRGRRADVVPEAGIGHRATRPSGTVSSRKGWRRSSFFRSCQAVSTVRRPSSVSSTAPPSRGSKSRGPICRRLISDSARRSASTGRNSSIRSRARLGRPGRSR